MNYVPLSGNPLIVPATLDPAKLAIYQSDSLVPGQPFHIAPGRGGYIIPANLLDPNAVLFMGTGAIPKPNTANGTQYIASPKQPTDVREDVVRIDHNFNDKYHLMGHWIHDSMDQTIYPSMWDGDSYVTVGDVFNNPTWGTVIKLTQSLSPTILNETSFNVNGNTINISPVGIYAQPAGWSAVGIFEGNNTLDRMPSITFSGAPNTEWNVNYWPWRNSYLNYQPRDDLSWSKGSHQFKFGAAYMRNDKNQQQQANTQGDYTFNQSSYSGDAYANFLLGFASTYQQLNQQDVFHWLNNTFSFYAQDNWHVRQRLTLNLGIRFDGLPHVYEKDNRTSNFVPADFSVTNAQTPDPVTGSLNPAGPGFSQPPGAPVPFYLNGVKLAGVDEFPRGLVENHYGTWQPRIGFAYNVDKANKTVVRGGYGLFFERVQGNDIYGTDVNPPNAYQPNVSAVYFSDPNTSNKTGQTAWFRSSLAALAPFSMPTHPRPHSNTAWEFSTSLRPPLSLVAVRRLSGWNQSDERNINTLPISDMTDRRLASAARTQISTGSSASPTSRKSKTGRTELQLAPNQPASAELAQPHHAVCIHLVHEIDIQSGDLGSTNISDRAAPFQSLQPQIRSRLRRY